MARIPILAAGYDLRPEFVCNRLQMWLSLKTANSRWHRHVLQMVGWLRTTEFTRADLAAFEPWLAGRFPGSKTPSQTLSRILQEMRDAGLVEFVARGRYRLLV
jgi:type II restriction enzyme